MNINDDQLDQRLRETPRASEDFLAQLHAIPEDVEIEQWMGASVELPAGFTDRLHGTIDECEFERQLGDAPGVASAVARLYQIPSEADRRRRRQMQWVVGGVAAMFALIVQLASFVGAVQVARPAEPAVLIVDLGPLELTVPPPSDAIEIGPTFAVVDEKPEPELAPQIDPPWIPDNSSPWMQVAHLIDSGVDLAEDVVLSKWGVLGAPNDPEETTPELEETLIEAPRGMEPPPIRGVYDRGFLLREKENPPLAPSRHPALVHSRPPLTKRTDSVDLVRRWALRDRLPDEAELRVEDFIAAERYDFPVQPGEIRLAGVAGPSRFSSNGAGMMQLAVALGRAPVDPEPTHWTLAVDVSSGMAWRHRLLEVRRAVARLFREMRPADRFSLVTFREDASIAAELVTRDRADEVLQVIDSWEPRGRCDFVAGVGQGISSAVEGGFAGRRRLVILSDGRGSWPAAVVQQIESQEARSRRLGVEWHWLELARSEDASPALVKRLRSRGVDAAQVGGDGEAGAAILEKWYGRSLLAAQNAKLHVRFEPRSVAFHRLVGHQASAWGGLESLEHEIDLRLGDQTSVLYEVWLKPNGPSTIAVATLSWRNPNNGRRERRRFQVLRADFMQSFADSPGSLQHATLAAEAGEVLSRSAFATNRNRTLKDVIAASREVQNELKQSGEFRRFVKWLELVERVRQRRGD